MTVEIVGRGLAPRLGGAASLPQAAGVERAARARPTIGGALALVPCALLASSCLCDDLAKDSLPAFLRFDPPADCDGAIFDREFAQCPTMDMSWPNIWESLAPPLTRDSAHAFVREHQLAIDACCSDPALVELDVVIACDGTVVDTRVRAPWFVGGCIDDAVRSWTFARPQDVEAAFHMLLPCGQGA
jgi:hypothetical protein